MARISRLLVVGLAASTLALALPSAVGASSNVPRLVLKGTQDCVSVESGTVIPGLAVVLAPCNGTVSQRFVLRAHSLIYAATLGLAIPLCIGNHRALGKAELLGCKSHNAQVRTVSVGRAGLGFSLTGGFLNAPVLGQVLITNTAHVTGREVFVHRG
jgi:Na+-translocating ferredoxin:NAD+ oxidoreductase RnfE subunit